MENNIKKIVELEIDLDNIELDDMGVHIVSFVEEPAIEVDFMAFAREEFVDAKAGESEDDFMGRCIPQLISEGYDEDQAIAICYGSFEGKESFKFETYNDYPEAAKANAQRALDWAEKEGWGTCGEATGKQRANQLAKGENISEETIARMASFERHRQNSDTPYTEGCGKLMWDAWGGDEGIAWAQRKLKQIRNEEMDADTSGLSPYVDQLDKPIKKENYVMSDEEQKIILDWAGEYGEQITEDYTYLNLNENFADVGDIAKVITGLDILGKLGIKQDEPAETKYRYTSLSGGAQRGFCRALMGLNKLYSRKDIDVLESRLGTINPNMGEGGRNNYDVFKYKGGVSCQHSWFSVGLYKPEGSRKVLMIEQGPAEGDAGKSNNGKTPSPTGSVTNNASVSKDFAFSIQNEEKRIVAGALMIPNQFILRRDENGEPYYVFFSRNTIKRIQERFNKLGYQNVTDVDHDGQIKTDNILLEQWIIESKEHDKSKFYGFHNLSLGTWFGVYKVNNDETWADIKSGKIKGFSIAGDFISKGTAVKDESETLLSKIITVLNEIKE